MHYGSCDVSVFVWAERWIVGSFGSEKCSVYVFKAPLVQRSVQL